MRRISIAGGDRVSKPATSGGGRQALANDDGLVTTEGPPD
jgi:hypothetical protein